MAAHQDHKEAERREEVKFNLDNVHLLQVQSVGEDGAVCTGGGLPVHSVLEVDCACFNFPSCYTG